MQRADWWRTWYAGGKAPTRQRVLEFGESGFEILSDLFRSSKKSVSSQGRVGIGSRSSTSEGMDSPSHVRAGSLLSRIASRVRAMFARSRGAS